MLMLLFVVFVNGENGLYTNRADDMVNIDQMNGDRNCKLSVLEHMQEAKEILEVCPFTCCLGPPDSYLNDFTQSILVQTPTLRLVPPARYTHEFLGIQSHIQSANFTFTRATYNNRNSKDFPPLYVTHTHIHVHTSYRHASILYLYGRSCAWKSQ